MKKVYLKCAKKLPHQRNCFACTHKCLLRGDDYIDNSIDKSETEYAENMKELNAV